jgi:organic radical activating enzyme
MKKMFCQYINYQTRYEYDSISPCCWITRKGKLDTVEDITQYKNWVSSIDDWIPECHYCKNLEDNKLNSPRLTYVEQGEEPSHTLEFQFDTDCNAACLICNEENSTTWEKYNLKNQNKSIRIVNQNRKEIVDQRFNNIKKTIDFNGVENISFLGGEPLKTRTHFEILKLSENFLDLSNLNVSYVTNGSYIPDQDILDLWKKCKTVSIAVSVDGTEDHFEYLRWPLKWNQLIDTLNFYKNLDFIYLNFSHSVNPFNIFYHDRYSKWADDFFKNSPHKGHMMFSNPFPTVGKINMHCLPDELTNLVREKYKNYYYSKFFNDILSPGDNLSKFIKRFDYRLYKEFIDYINYHDLKRSLNWRSTFPEIQSFFKE